MSTPATPAGSEPSSPNLNGPPPSDGADTNHDDELLFFRRRRHVSLDVITGLNLTAMMDIMTIILVFLIKRFADAPENITINDDLRPPASTAQENIVPSISVYISQSVILVDNKAVLEIEGGKVKSSDPANAYAPLAQALEGRVAQIRALEGRVGSKIFDGYLMVIADENVPYELIYGVLYHAGKADFNTYRLVVRTKAE